MIQKDRPIDLTAIGQRLKTLRAYQRKTQSVMANEVGISLSHYSKLEIGVGTMSHGLVLALCRQFNISEDWLLYGEGEEPSLDQLLQVAQRNQQMKAAVMVPDKIPDEVLDEMMKIIIQDGFKELAEQVAATMKISVPRAMTMLLKGKLRNFLGN